MQWRFCPRCGQALAAGTREGVARALCAAPGCGFVHWDNPVPVAAALVERAGCVVLARNRDWAPGKFGLITGFIERAESPAQAAAREVREELALDAHAVELIGIYPFERANQLIVAYHVVADGEIRLNEELAEYRAVPIDKLRGWDFGTGLAVRDWLASRR